jgi:tetratricopeptide (TPR) repeat protein
MQQRQLAAIAAGLVMLLIAGRAEPVRADQDDPRLDGLFQRLQHTPDPAEAQVVEQQIWQLWLASEDAAIDRLMQQGVFAMNEQDYATALQTFTRMVDQAPDFAEGWNKRATVLYLMGEIDRSRADVEKVLELEPRHFGALSGLGLLYMAEGEAEKALEAFRRALAVNPTMPGPQQWVEELKERVEGQPI